MATKMTEAQDEAYDRKKGIKENSPRDMKQDKMDGVTPDMAVKRVTHGHVNRISGPGTDQPSGAPGGPQAGSMNPGPSRSVSQSKTTGPVPGGPQTGTMNEGPSRKVPQTNTAKGVMGSPTANTMNTSGRNGPVTKKTRD
jgi:hypothetical protein